MLKAMQLSCQTNLVECLIVLYHIWFCIRKGNVLFDLDGLEQIFCCEDADLANLGAFCSIAALYKRVIVCCLLYAGFSIRGIRLTMCLCKGM